MLELYETAGLFVLGGLAYMLFAAGAYYHERARNEKIARILSRGDLPRG